MLVDEIEQRAGLAVVVLDAVREGIRALLLDAAQVVAQGAVRGQATVVEKAHRPVVHGAVVLAQVRDVENEVRRVLRELVLGMLHRDGGEVLLGGVELAGKVFEPADLESDLDGMLPVGKHVEIEQARVGELALVGRDGPLLRGGAARLRAAPRLRRSAGPVRVLPLRLGVARNLGPRHDRAPGGFRKPLPRLLAGLDCREVLPGDRLVQLCRLRLLPEPVQELTVEEA